MSEETVQEAKSTLEDAGAPQAGPKLPWEPPRIEDVSEEVMAQPYIRFT